MTIGLHQLRCFVAVAEHGHVTKAARSLFMTQPALSVQIRSLERAVGVPLFTRHARGVDLTDAGRAFLTHARFCLSEYEDGVAAASAAGRGVTDTVCVGIIGGTQIELISHVLRAFRLAQPRTLVDLIKYTCQTPSAGLFSDETEAAFVVLPMTDSGLGTLPLMQPAVVAALPVDHRCSGRHELSIKDILDEPWVSADTSDLICRDYWLATECRTQAPIVHHRVRTMDKFIQLVAAGEAVGIAPGWVRDAYGGRPVDFVPVTDVASPTLALAWRLDEQPQPAVAALRRAAQSVVDHRSESGRLSQSKV